MRMVQASLIVSLALLAVACGGSSSAKADGSTGRCIPGQSAACTGADACSGFQVCNASGTFEACVCGTGSDASSGAPSAPDAIEASAIPVTAYVTTLAGSAFA